MDTHMDPGVKLCDDHRELLPNPDHYHDLVSETTLTLRVVIFHLL